MPIVARAAICRTATLAALVSCSSDPPLQAELEDVCGQPSPVRVLPLGEDEFVQSAYTLRMGDRVVYLVGQIDRADPDAWIADFSKSTVWSAGPCGESPVELATDVYQIFTVAAWPDAVLACNYDTGDVIALDPAGVKPAHVVMPAVTPERFRCSFDWTDAGALSLVAHDEEFAALRLHPYPADPFTDVTAPVQLVESIRIGPRFGVGSIYLPGLLRSHADHVLALTDDESLVRIDLSDRTVSIVQEGVRFFEASDDGSFLLWQDAASSTTDPEFPVGDVWLRGPGLDGDVFVDRLTLGHSSFSLRHADEGLLQIGLTNLYPGKDRLYLLPGLEHVDMLSRILINGRLPDGRWAVDKIWDNYLDALSLPENVHTRLFPRQVELRAIDDDALEVLEVPQCCVDADFRAEGPLWRVPLDGSTATRLAARATRNVKRLSDGRRVGSVGVGSHWLGPLVIIDPESQEELHIDERVHYYSVDATQTDATGLVTYSVTDGARSGIYVAKLPTPEDGVAQPERSTPGVHALDWIEGPDGRAVPRMRAIESERPAPARIPPAAAPPA